MSVFINDNQIKKMIISEMFYSIISIVVLFLNIKVYPKVTFSKSDEKENIKWALSRKRCDIAASMCV